MKQFLLISAILALCSAGFAFGLLGAKVYADYEIAKRRCENGNLNGFTTYGYFENGSQFTVHCVVDSNGRFVKYEIEEIK